MPFKLEGVYQYWFQRLIMSQKVEWAAALPCCHQREKTVGRKERKKEIIGILNVHAGAI